MTTLSKNLIIPWTQEWVLKKHIPHIFLKKTSSTNDTAKQAKPSAQPLFIFCQTQAKGRGQGKNLWEDSDFMASWTWKQPHSPPYDFSLLVGQSLHQVLKQVWPHPPWRFKAPNDIYIQDKKIAGILIEVLSSKNFSHTIIGIGINVFTIPKKISSAGYIHQHTSVQQKCWFLFLDLFWQKILSFKNNNTPPPHTQ